MFNPSLQQSGVFRWATDASGNLVIVAVAGSGKTTTLVELLRCLPVRDPSTFLPPAITFLAFNKSVAETLAARCPKHVACRTFHSLGLSALKPLLPKGFKIDGRKCSKLVWDRMDYDHPDAPGVIKLVGLLKSVLPGSVSIEDLARHYDVDISESSSFRVAEQVLLMSNAKLDVVDFDDMLYLPVLLNAQFAPQDWVLVDEAQDTNDIQLEILSRLRRMEYGYASGKTFSFEHRTHSTRFVFVGDPHQAIYGFRGANSDSMTRIAQRFACASLPLSVSYRCPKAVVAEARKYLTKEKDL